MRTRILLAGLALALSATARAGLYYSDNGSAGWVIPDNSPGGLVRTIQSTGEGDGTLTSVSVVFNIKGGFNGDLFGYLTYKDSAGSEKTQILLNRIGGGSSALSGSGFGTGATTLDYGDLLNNGVRLVDAGTGGNIHYVQPGVGNIVPVGNYAPDSTVNFMETFYGMKCNGTWTLFFADRVTGDQSTLVSLGVGIVPEPVNVALGIFGVLASGASFGRWWSRRRAAGTA